MYIYTFGSVSRGDVTCDSDIDLLAVVNRRDSRFDPEAFSVYTRERLGSLWKEGNPFAWNLALEAVLVHSSDGTDYLKELGSPAVYLNMLADCRKFYAIYQDAAFELRRRRTSAIFELSVVFLAIRNAATCYSLGGAGQPDFSRHSATRLSDYPLVVDREVYEILSCARTLSTRGRGRPLTMAETGSAVEALPAIEEWMSNLIKKAECHEGVSN